MMSFIANFSAEVADLQLRKHKLDLISELKRLCFKTIYILQLLKTEKV